jgi:hypothetical protein
MLILAHRRLPAQRPRLTMALQPYCRGWAARGRKRSDVGSCHAADARAHPHGHGCPDGTKKAATGMTPEGRMRQQVHQDELPEHVERTEEEAARAGKMVALLEEILAEQLKQTALLEQLVVRFDS